MIGRREAGLVQIFCADGGRPVEAGTVACCHCGGHWVPSPGSGRVRGFCQNCSGFVCGPGCAACIPTDLLLENAEKGRRLDFRPIIVPAAG